VSALARLAIRGYRRFLSPLVSATPLGTPRCKYYPSCSRYALDAYGEYGFVRGTILTAWRLLRCNPWSHGGVDYAHEQHVFPLLGDRS
jgi:putative membrane protein insertion efficiency factor